MAWTAVDSLNPPKAANRLITDTGAGVAGGIRLYNGACVLYRIVLTCLVIDTADALTLVTIEDAAADTAGTIVVVVPFVAAGDTVELRFRNGFNFAAGLGLDLGGGTTGNGQVMITKMFAQTAQA